jgi:uncharacterized protein (DUF1499 family)
LLQVRLETTLFFQLSPQTVVVVVVITLRQATVDQVAVVVVSQGSLQVAQVTPLQLHQHKEPTVEQVEQIAPPIVGVVAVVVLQVPEEREAHLGQGTLRVATVEQVQRHQ